MAGSNSGNVSGATEGRPGRPRSVESQQAILRSTLELLAESGYIGLRIEAVAARAGVGKSTIYRHWSTKHELVAEALGTTASPEVPDTGSVRGDLLVLGRRRVANLNARDAERLLPRLLGETADNPGLRELIGEQLVRPREAIVAMVLRRGIERGEVSADVDVDLVAATVLGALLYRYATGRRESEKLPGRVYDLLVEGIAP